jgi:hypothetical protein
MDGKPVLTGGFTSDAATKDSLSGRTCGQNPLDTPDHLYILPQQKRRQIMTAGGSGEAVNTGTAAQQIDATLKTEELLHVPLEQIEVEKQVRSAIDMEKEKGIFGLTMISQLATILKNRHRWA